LVAVDRLWRPTPAPRCVAAPPSPREPRRSPVPSDERSYHTRTGCFFHASYWPAKLRWLRGTRPSAFRRTTHWISLGEYLYLQLLGQARVSLSIASGTGLLDVRQCHWDAQALELAGIDWEHLSPLEDGTQPFRSLRPAF